jgi:membrane associated rhomboid family serine protease
MSKLIEQLVERYGVHSNSFLALYSGYHYFHLEDPSLGCIAYIRTKNAWVGLAEPFATTDNQLALLTAFMKEAEIDGKKVVFLPVGERFRQLAQQAGFRAFQIGSEPYFNLDYYPHSGKSWLDVSHSAKALRSKGYQVKKFDFDTCSREIRIELTQIQQEWLESRKTGELGFVNRVEPEFLSHLKAHFYIEWSGRIYAFLSAIPMNQRKAWYFIDVIRRRDTPAGCVEMLMLEAMRLLKEEGAKHISLGVAPLAPIALPLRGHVPSALENKMKYFFENFQWFYNFKSLYEFKNKFHPSEWKVAYAMHSFERTDHRFLAVLTDCFVPRGVTFAVTQMLRRKLNPRSMLREVKSWMTESLILRSNPRSVVNLFSRAPCSIIILAIFSLIFIGTFESGVPQFWTQDRAFSFVNMTSIHSVQSAVQVFLVPAFLHWNIPHILFNAITLVLFGTSLEIFFGSSFFLLSYFAAVLLTNPITAILIWILSKMISTPWPLAGLSSLDVGASLGIWSCAGAWSYFLKNRRFAWIMFSLTVLSIAYVEKDALQFNHIIAASVGYLVARKCFPGLSRGSHSS